MRAPVVLLLVTLALFAGCASDSKPAETSDEGPGPSAIPMAPFIPNTPGPNWSAIQIIDDTRAGGEPVIAITPEGTILVSAHPGYTHYHPSVPEPTGPELVIPSQTQSYMWRSTDGGETFRHISLLPVDAPNSGPRGAGQGVSDPDFTIDANGKIYFTDLEALAAASVSWSDDDGETWLMGNNLASGRPVDRQWLAAYGTTVYFRANAFGMGDVRKSEDGGMTWQDVGDSGCGGDMVANPNDGRLYVGCGNGISVSSDGGVTWDGSNVDVNVGGHGMTEPAIDAKGNVYMAADPDYTDVVLLATPDDGATWTNLSLKQFFPELANGTLLWPWVSAGSEGRVSVTFFASESPEAYANTAGVWYVYNVILINANKPGPEVYPTRATLDPFHVGAICQGGTGCQATTAIDKGSDRRLGDFFETTIDAAGMVHIVFSDTHANPTHTISHVGYVRQTGGPSLIEGEVPAGFPTQG